MAKHLQHGAAGARIPEAMGYYPAFVIGSVTVQIGSPRSDVEPANTTMAGGALAHAREDF
ncbi:MAG: hypothetical protein EBY25_02050 [Betaproteobacteria bacterium]|nr:hypothetical protein [Betaproteobacteria bacterium]NDA99747.1 hypothetical protein [Betaproteobacteria bacterium]NDE72503.1 hypothetical protein [Betaproteobacteria bacterium]